ncbi:MAG TPA: thioesterase domain-containing protein [Candidatus Binataceae bacterium]|nr:thioesterase domain-containing protein [Candidatus Binataceae bacterium]
MRRKFYTVLRGSSKVLTVVPDKTPIVVLQRGGNRPPFFMIDSYPYFIDVVRLLGAEQPVLSLIGQQATQTSDAYSIADEATSHVKTMLEWLPNGPFMLGGCSASGIVAYEIAQQLRACGRDVDLLVMFDTHNTRFMREYSRFWMSLAHYRADLSRLNWIDVPGWATDKLRGLFDRNLTEMRRRSNPGDGAYGSTAQFEPLSSRILAAREYRPKPYEGRFLLFKRRPQLPGRYQDPHYGWRELVKGTFDIFNVSSLGHNDIFRSELDRLVVANALLKCIDEVMEASSANLSLGVA